MNKLKYIAIGFVIGLLMGGGIVWAATSIVWVNDSGAAMGTASNPVYITSN